MRFFQIFQAFLIPIFPQYHRGGMSSKSVHGREAKSLKNGIPTLCKRLQFNSSASPCRPSKQTNKQKAIKVPKYLFISWYMYAQKWLVLEPLSKDLTGLVNPSNPWQRIPCFITLTFLILCIQMSRLQWLILGFFWRKTQTNLPQ